MAQWPPSPSVEDEATALANEHSLDMSIQSLKSEDQPALSRGSVDQLPIIIDSDDQRETFQAENTMPPKQGLSSSSLSSEACSSDDSTGPATPPPLVRNKGRSKNSETMQAGTDRKATQLNPTGPSTRAEMPASARGRPQGMHIHTDVHGDVRAKSTSTRQERSSYFHSPVSARQSWDSSGRPTEHPLTSPSRVTTSPVVLHQQPPRPSPPQEAYGYDRAEDVVTNSKESARKHSRSKSRRRKDGSRTSDLETRDGGKVRQNTSRRRSHTSTRPDIHQPNHEPAERRAATAMPISPPYSRRQSKESSSYASASDERIHYYRPRYSRRNTKESPHTSSAEDSSRENRRGINGDNGHDGQKHRRRSSHRKERPDLTRLAEAGRSGTFPSLAVDSSSYHHREPRSKGHAGPMTPLSSDPMMAEDYFARAFKENYTRGSQSIQPARASGSALVSPFTSPPRTPRLEQQGKDYFDLTPTNQRPVQRSRPPSIDEGQSRDPKLHNSLLSAATAGAAIAARASASSARSSGQLADIGSNAPRSRRPSPVYEESRGPIRHTSYGNTDVVHATRESIATAYDVRPTSRGSASNTEINAQPHQQVLPIRALSYSGPEQKAQRNGLSSTTGLGLTGVATSGNTNASLPSYNHNNTASYDRGTRVPSNTGDSALVLTTDCVLPTCPRTQPKVGLHDWYTVKGMSKLDLCPTCMGGLGNTRYRDWFSPSPPRPHSQASVCAMSDPWVRIAFTQSLRHGRPDLEYVRAVTTLPPKVMECSGPKHDLRRWFDIMDSTRKEPVPDFFVCSACVRKVDVVFPNLERVFDRPDDCLAREHICSLHSSGKHFQSIIDQLRQAESRCQGHKWRNCDVEGLVRHIRRISRFQPCPRDEAHGSRTWHFIAELPEFTVCEGCYEAVVWPLSDRPIARDVSKTAKLVPTRRSPDGSSAASCQLYSDRMRRVFRDAVAHRDFGRLRDAVRARVGAHHRILEMNRLYEQDQRAGINRQADIERNVGIWRQME